MYRPCMKFILSLFMAVASGVYLLPDSTALVHAQGSCAPIDVAIVMDTTSSMTGAIENVKAAAIGIVDQISSASGGDYQLALVEFRDYINVLVDLAPNTGNSVKAQIATLSASGGNGAAEASDEALNTVVNNLSAGGRPQTGNFSGAWRQAANKIIIMITDAPPAGFDDSYTVGTDDVNANARAQEAKAKGIKISAVFVPTHGNLSASGTNDVNSINAGDDVIVETIMRNYQTVTNGGYIKTLPDGTGTANAISLTISACGSPGEIDLSTPVPLTPVPPTPVPVPEPITIILFGSGLVGLAGMVQRRKKQVQ